MSTAAETDRRSLPPYTRDQMAGIQTEATADGYYVVYMAERFGPKYAVWQGRGMVARVKGVYAGSQLIRQLQAA